MSRTFTRDQFYELVWSKPMTHLAKEFAISDVALHKICRKHEVPTPPPGWWAKKAAGKPVRQTPLSEVSTGAGDQITIAAGLVGPEPELVARARDNARVLASSIEAIDTKRPNPVVERTAAKLRRAKPDAITGLVSIEGAGFIKSQIAPASIDRFALALNRIAAAADGIGIKLIRGDQSAAFAFSGETIGFSVSESTKREKHVATPEELAAQEQARRRRERRWNNPGSWRSDDYSLFYVRLPEWDYHPTGQLALELEHCYLLGGSPRRSFRDAKIQRLEAMAADIAVGIAALVAAKQEDRRRREEEAKQREEARRRRELALRAKHVEERRSSALDGILEELASLERLQRLVGRLPAKLPSSLDKRLSAFLAFARERLASREEALSPKGLTERFEKARLFGPDDDHGFRPSNYY